MSNYSILFGVLFTGATASAIRADIMILILNLGIVFKRNYSSLAANTVGWDNIIYKAL